MRAEVVLFHHAQGLTAGVEAFADELRGAGHAVHAPDLFDGRTFSEFAEGMAYVEELGFGTIIERGRAAAESLPQDVVYAGFSLGVLPAQMLAQTRAGARGALLFDACVPPSEFGGPWPSGLPLQIHIMEGDQLAAEDIEAAREIESAASSAELFLYPGDRHLFADRSLPSYDASAAALLMQRVLAFLEPAGPAAPPSR